MSAPWNLPGMFSQMRERLESLQASLEHREVEALVAGGQVRVKANGRGRIVSITIDPEALAEPEMLQDLIVAATNQALERAQELAQREMQQLLGPLAGVLGRFGT